MACNFIAVLSKLRKLSMESVENTASFDDFKKYLHVLRPVEEELRSLLNRVNAVNKKTLILLCGSAGDGKSHLLSYLRNADSANLLNGFELYNDATESSAPLLTAGQTLTSAQNDLLLLGCVIKNYDERIISMSPLHPLNVLYQLNLLEENDVGEIRENLIEKLSPLYLLPYIKDGDKTLYHAIERKHSPEWRVYAQLSNKRYQGTRNFVQKLVRDKITQYIDHFKFLFDDLGNDQFCINLINMGDCREVLQGLILFYVKELKAEISPEELKHFVINIYSQAGDYNDSLAAAMDKLYQFQVFEGDPSQTQSLFDTLNGVVVVDCIATLYVRYLYATPRSIRTSYQQCPDERACGDSGGPQVCCAH